MGAFVRVSDVWEAFDPRARVSNAWENVQTGFVRVNGAWEKFYSAVTAATVSIAPIAVEGRADNQNGAIVTSDTATANVSDGVGPFTYQWSHVSGGLITIDSATANQTTFSSFLNHEQTVTGVYQVTVTDTGNGNAITTDNVTVTLSNEELV